MTTILVELTLGFLIVVVALALLVAGVRREDTRFVCAGAAVAAFGLAPLFLGIVHLLLQH
jgi:hypothetical protein